MPHSRPSSPAEYKLWLWEELRVDLPPIYENHYEAVTRQAIAKLQETRLWQGFLQTLRAGHDEYALTKDYPLLRSLTPQLVAKPYDSMIHKTFRKNVLHNDAWPDPPEGGWYLPDNWLSRLKDIIRTMLEVKYLDGVEFLARRIHDHFSASGAACEHTFEAREDGYYAAHVNFTQDLPVPRLSWDTERMPFQVEIQITTQLQEVIRRLLHRYYEEARSRGPSSAEPAWQWAYSSEAFAANYLGHILHYVEGMIMEIRDKQARKEKSP